MKVIKISDYNNQQVRDNEVISRVLNGDKFLFEILMRRHNQKVFRVVRSYISEEAVIKDVMQNAYLKAYQNLHQFNRKSEFSTWLVRIAINEALKELEVRKKRHVNLVVGNRSSEMASAMTTDMGNPEHTLIRNEAKWVLEKAIDELPPKYRTVYILKEIEGMKIAAISECLNISEGNVKTRAHRSRQMLKDKLYELSRKPNVFEFGFEKCDALVHRVMTEI